MGRRIGDAQEGMKVWLRGHDFGAAMSSSPWDRLWNGDEDVATPAWDQERGGDVLIAVGRSLARGRRGRRYHVSSGEALGERRVRAPGLERASGRGVLD
jgi:hypothetical protein